MILLRRAGLPLVALVVASLVSPAFAETSDGSCPVPTDAGAATLASDVDAIASAAARARVESAMAKLDAQRNGEFGEYYADGVRVEGCWANPAGNKLTDLQKAFYCSMPLEFRLCNTVALLTTKGKPVDERYAGYLACQQRVDAAFGGTGRFRYDDEINSVYKELYLAQDSGLSGSDQAAIIAAARPKSSGRPFPVLLHGIVNSLGREAVDRAAPDLATMFREARAAGLDE